MAQAPRGNKEGEKFARSSLQVIMSSNQMFLGGRQVLSAPGQMPPMQQRPEMSGQASTLLSILTRFHKLQVRQQRQWLETLTGLERNNRYVLRDEMGNDVFFLKENSSCWERNCCSGSCKAWRMDLYLLGPEGLAGGLASMTPALHFERPCTLTCFCLNRPEVFVSDLGS